MNKKQKLYPTLTTAILLLLMTSTIAITQPVTAQTTPTNMQDSGSIQLPSGVTPDVTEKTRAFLSFNPNVIGVNQPLLVNLWINPALHASRYFTDFTVTFTKPDKTTDVVTVDSYYADATAWLHYYPDQEGEWKIKFDFPGGYYPAGNYTVPSGTYIGVQTVNFARSVYYEPSSSPEQTFTVQTDIVYSWPVAQLPTDYWTRPISLNNREWWPILGNYPGTGYEGGGDLWNSLYPDTNPAWSDRYCFTPYVQAPDSAHIVWKRQGAIAGLIGGPAGQYGSSGSAGTPTVIYSGRCYQTYNKAGVGSVAACYDLRTGQVYYENPISNGGVTPSYVSYVSPDLQTAMTGSVPGTEAQTTWSVELLSIANGRLIKVDPWTGAATLNVSISPLTGSGGTYYKNTFVLAVQNLGTTSNPDYRLINWTTVGSTTNFTQRIVSNTTYARAGIPSTYEGVIDYNAGFYATVAGDVSDRGATDSSGTASTGTATKMTVSSFKLQTGEKIWNITVNEAQYNPLCNIADHGKIAVLTQNGYFVAYDLATGKLAWQSETMAYPWGESSFGDYGIQSAYGMFFWAAYDGIYAFNWTNGKIAWHYQAPAYAAFETPYTSNGTSVYSFMAMFNTRIADGKLYTYNGEHSASWPITRGWSLHCINITSGEGLWNISGQQSPGAIADGYLTAANSWDGYMYVYGKGQTSTTVTATPKIIANGAQVLIEGTVLDQSPAQSGTPCVSKDSMTLQMEYLHMQQPIGGIWGNQTIVGVPVVLTAVDSSNGNIIDLGTVTTNGYYGTFSYVWTPPHEGTYEIMASFAADESYGSSSASTAISVTINAESTPVTTTGTLSMPPFELYTIGSALAIILAIAVVAVLLLKKKP
ncbi:MAG: PQQ-binding-like beta-propeller repeat protein [Candidatus Bathyarchaeia archaeon]|jgi:hypothetical protein